MSLREDAKFIYENAIRHSLPDSAVKEALSKFELQHGKLILVAIGKAAWQMANAAHGELGDKIDCGIVITKHEHSRGEIGTLEIYEAGHPVPDEAGLRASRRVLEVTSNLSKEDVVLFLVSGGGSALFEYVDFPLEELSALTNQMLASGASIEEMNTVRKHLSSVKGGRFAEHVAPAKVFAVVLSDIISSRLDMIASGPTVADSTTAEDAVAIAKKYALTLTQKQKELLARETPKQIDNAQHIVSGSVAELCRHAADAAKACGYEARIVTDCMDIEAKEAGRQIGAMAADLARCATSPQCLIFGGETVVHLRGNGKGGRNQELALTAAKYINGIENVAVFSVGSDGTDGPTDAAGGYVDGSTYSSIKNYDAYLENNDSYNALKEVDGLIITGPTGTNVNDIAVILVK